MVRAVNPFIIIVDVISLVPPRSPNVLSLLPNELLFSIMMAKLQGSDNIQYNLHSR